MKSYGKLIYSPRSHLGLNKDWVVLMCDDEISKYYRTLFSKEFPWEKKLNRPIWGAHISVIRGENLPNKHLWGLNANQIIEFDYYPGVINNDKFYWLKARCKALSDLRLKYGLSEDPKFGFHLTLALN